VCRFHVAACKAKLGRGAIYKLFEAVAKPVRVTFSCIVCSSPDRHNIGFLTEGNLLLYSSHLPLGVPNGLVIQLAIIQHFGPSNTRSGIAYSDALRAGSGPGANGKIGPWYFKIA
jgi:hypothetical protein